MLNMLGEVGVLQVDCTLIKKKFLIYKEIRSGADAKSYLRKGFLIYEKMRKYFPMCEEAPYYSQGCLGRSTATDLRHIGGAGGFTLIAQMT